MASILWDESYREHPPYVKAEETYFGRYEEQKPPPRLRIATGGAGQSGLVRALANAFINDQVEQTKCDPFSVEWLKSDTAGSFNYLAQASADLSITYHKKAEEIARDQGVCDRRIYAWRDHFMLIGPDSNPADLDIETQPSIHPRTPEDRKPSIGTLFTKLFRAAIKSNNNVRFLSRFDKSATNIKESSIWTEIGQVPWAYPYSFFYHVMTVFPFQALQAASELGEYHLTDWGTWNGVKQNFRDNMTIHYLGTDDDPEMLNPARVLVGTNGQNRDMANMFADWMIKDDGGQKVVSEFEINGVRVYTKAPKDRLED